MTFRANAENPERGRKHSLLSGNAAPSGADRRGPPAPLAAIALAAVVTGLWAGTALGESCRPSRPRPPIVLKDMGPCGFDLQAMSFRGEPAEQARCLMRGMDSSRNLAPAMESLPAPLATRVGQESGLPSREILSGYLSKQDLEWDFAAYLWQPLARARDNDPAAPMARYFVIYDTSGPSFGRRDFPADIDVSPKINNLANFQCQDGWGKAHVVISRTGGVLLDHEFAIPWRETKFERAVNFAGALKGLFIHIEMIQPRRSAGRSRHNDAQTPNPSFTSAQYDRLALIYIAASVRAGHWLVPAFHAALDANIRDGHDDPLNFNVESFAASIDRMMVAVTKPAEQPPVATSGPATPVAAAPAPAPQDLKKDMAGVSAGAASAPAQADTPMAPSPAAAISSAEPVHATEADPDPHASATSQADPAHADGTAPSPVAAIIPAAAEQGAAVPAVPAEPASPADAVPDRPISAATSGRPANEAAIDTVPATPEPANTAGAVAAPPSSTVTATGPETNPLPAPGTLVKTETPEQRSDGDLQSNPGTDSAR